MIEKHQPQEYVLEQYSWKPEEDKYLRITPSGVMAICDGETDEVLYQLITAAQPSRLVINIVP